MCLIVVKPQGKELPNNKRIRQWFNTHSDGFGLMYSGHDGMTHILKGAMTIDTVFSLLAKLKRRIRPLVLKNIDLVLHFRQATDGTVCPANCHPFPVTADTETMGQTDLATNIGLVHNGIIWDYGTYTAGKWYTNITSDKTDTQRFIEDYLANMGDAIYNVRVQSLIEKYTDSKFALLTPRGLVLIGKFITEDGLQFSNGGFKPCRPSVVSYTAPDYGGNWEPTGYGRQSQFELEKLGDACALCYLYYDYEDLYELNETLVCDDCYHKFTGHYPIKSALEDCDNRLASPEDD